MKQKIALVLAGLVAGAFMSALIPAQAHHSTDVATLARKVRQLQAKTQNMDTDGFYNGLVASWQVLSLCEAGSGATWAQVPIEDIDLRYLYDCDTTTSRKAMKQHARAFLKSLER